MLLILTEPKLHTSESSSDVTSVHAFLSVSFCLSPKLKLKPGSPVFKACLQFSRKTGLLGSNPQASS